MTKKIYSRRQFLGNAGTAAAAPLILSARAAGADGNKAPSERIGIGIVGCGAMNGGHTKRYIHFHSDDAQVVAVCDPFTEKREKYRQMVDEAYAAEAGQGSYKGCKAYNDFRELLQNPDVDAISVATPDHWHVIPALHALRMGKSAYVEKPMTLTIEEGRVLADEARRSRGVIQCGSHQRSHYDFPKVVELVRNGRIGELKRVVVGIHPGDGEKHCSEAPVPEGFDYDLWLGQAPESPYCPERCGSVRSWISIRDYGGGRIGSWGGHHLDIAQWAIDADDSGPVEISGTGTFPKSGLNNHAVLWDVDFRYANGVTVHMTNTRPQPYLMFIGSEGMIFANRTEVYSNLPGLIDSEIGENEWHSGVSDSHHQNFLNCVRSGEDPAAHAEIGHRSATCCHLATNCLVLGRTTKWDPVEERYIDDDEANAMISRKMRAPWSLYE